MKHQKNKKVKSDVSILSIHLIGIDSLAYAFMILFFPEEIVVNRFLLF